MDGSAYRALAGPVDVRGQRWEGDMPAWNASDEDLAAVLTYLRREWGNGVEPVTPEHDLKLQALTKRIRDKVAAPINPANQKVLVFSALPVVSGRGAELAAILVAGAARAVAARIAALGHETLQDAMESDAVVEADPGQVERAADVHGRDVRAHRDAHLALARDERHLGPLATDEAWAPLPGDELEPWTDDYSNLLRLLAR